MSETLALAGRLQLMDDEELIALASKRLGDTRGIRDFFDLADRLLDPASISRALATLDRFTLAALANPRPGSGDGRSLASATHLFLTDGGAPARPLDAVTRVLEEWPVRGLPSAIQLADGPPPAVDESETTTEHSDRKAAERAFAATMGVTELVHELGIAPLRELAKGGVASPDVKRLAASIALDSIDVDALLRIAQTSGLVSLDHLLWTRSDAAHAWLLRPTAGRWSALVSSWFEALPADIARVLNERSTAPWGADVRRYVTWLFPAGGDALSSRLTRVLESAEYLGITAEGRPGAAARALLGGEKTPLLDTAAALLPDEVSNVYLQHDLTVVAPGPLTPELDVRLRGLADIEGRGLASSYRISASSITRALAGGETADSILSFLRAVSLTGVPQPVEYLVTEASARYGRLRAGSTSLAQEQSTGARSYVRSDDPALLRTLAVDQGLAALALTEGGADRLTSRYPVETLYWMIADARYPIVAENDSGTTYSPVRTRSVRKEAAPAPRPFDDLVRRLRESEHEASAVPEAWIARQLEVAIRVKSPLMVTVGMPNDKTVVFFVTPLSLAAGRLRAIDERAGVERTLPLRNITEVLPAPSG